MCPDPESMASPARLSRRAARGLGTIVLANCCFATGCAEPAPLTGRVLVAAIDADPGQLNPAITTNGGVHTAAGLLYDGLVELDSALKPVPGLALRWAIEEDGALYRFHLRPGVRWHDGERFTAADVTFSFDSLLLRYHARTRASLAHVIAAIEAVDDSTVEFRFRQPYAPLLQQLNVVEAPILPRHLFAGADPLNHRANRAPVGTGPYRFASHRPDVEIRYMANDDWYGGRPDIDHVVLRVIPDPGSQVLALEAGEVDWLFGVPGPERARLRANPAIRFIETSVNPGGSNCITNVALNLDRPLLGDVRMRRALAHAIDRDQFVERVLFGAGRAADAPISSAIPFAHAAGLPVPAWDTAAAGRLLDGLGWRRGSDGMRVARGVAGIEDGTRLMIGFTQFPSYAPYGDLLRAQLRAVGIELRLVSLEQAVFVETVFTARDFDTAIISYCNGTDPEIGVRRMFVSSSIAPVPFSNAAGYRDAVMDSLWDLAGRALESDTRARLYRQIQELAVRDLPYLSLVETRATRAYRTRCSGFTSASHFAATARCTP